MTATKYGLLVVIDQEGINEQRSINGQNRVEPIVISSSVVDAKDLRKAQARAAPGFWTELVILNFAGKNSILRSEPRQCQRPSK